MDGTLAMFYEKPNCLELMKTDGFFRSLRPYATVITGISQFVSLHQQVLDWYLLSGAEKKRKLCIKDEKTFWWETCGDTLLCPIDHIIITNVGESKAAAISMKNRLCRDDILLDDFNLNLEDWQAAGGTAIKFVNEINDRGTNGRRWGGHRIRYDDPPNIICEKLKTFIF